MVESRRVEPNVEHPLAICIPCSAAERQALGLLRFGSSDEEISEALNISVDAVKARVKRFSGRTGLSGRLLAAWALLHSVCCVRADDPFIIFTDDSPMSS